MKKLLVLFLMSHLVSCQEKRTIRPVFLQPEIQTVRINQDQLIFKVQGENWSGLVQTTAQTLYPSLAYQGNLLLVDITAPNGVIEGPAILTLQSDNNAHHFPFEIKNPTQKVELVDLRSPKTVNVDSSLYQQQILYSVDPSGNLAELAPGVFFKENQLKVQPKTGTFPSLNGSPISSFYVAPGTVESIHLDYTMDASHTKFQIMAGPLYDQNQNLISDGTQISFLIKKGLRTERIEALVRAGYSYLDLSLNEWDQAQIQAAIAHVVSQELKIQKP